VVGRQRIGRISRDFRFGFKGTMRSFSGAFTRPMKTPLTILLLLPTLVALAAPDKEALRSELVRTEAEFFKLALERSFNAGMHAYMAEDGFIANSLTLTRDAHAAKMAAEKSATKARPNVIRWKPLRADVAESGDLGYTWGVAESGPGSDGPFRPYGIYVTIWKRQADGKWKFVYDAATILDAARIEAFLRENFPEKATEKKP
jgi:ketosteroid isomerase-like protein